MNTQELINRRAFKNKFYSSIRNGIIEQYNALYPANNVTVNYKQENEYYWWKVYIDGQTFNNNGTVVETLIHVDDFDNIVAAKLFSIIPFFEYEKEYNDYSEDNYGLLKKGIEQIIAEYSELGVIFEEWEVNKGGYRVVFYHPEFSHRQIYMSSWEREKNKDKPYFDLYRSASHGHFNVQPISKSTVKSKLSDVRKSVKYLLEKNN